MSESNKPLKKKKTTLFSKKSFANLRKKSTTLFSAKVPDQLPDHLFKLSDITLSDQSPKPNKNHSALTVTTADFHNIKLIGAGDVGKVYLVRQKSNNKLFAMKVLKKSEMLSRNKTHRALAEQHILLNSSHPFIVPLYHTFQTTNHLYFIMEYCCGGEFFRTLQTLPDKRLNEEQTRFYAAEVVCGVEYLHLMGFVWRDLKPENILLHSTGHVMLTDFDLSKHFTPTPPLLHRKKSFFGSITTINTTHCPSQANSFVGTEEYIAPEILTGIHHSAAVDWWTTGILIYEILFATTPFKGDSRTVTFENIINQKPTFPPCSNKARDLISRLLDKNESKRLGSAGASEIKTHPFFKDGWVVDGKRLPFDMVRCVGPPLGRPKVDADDDTRNFRSMRDSEAADFEGERVVDGDAAFEGFDCVSVLHAGW